MKSNYHSHTYLCGHATGNVDDYIKEAIKEKYQVFGISDHGYLTKTIIKRLNEYPWLKFQMDKEEFSTYLQMIEEAKEKYQGLIKIYKGLEVEYVFGEEEYYNELLKKLDYLILGVHYYLDENDNIFGTRKIEDNFQLYNFTKTTIKALESGYFKIIAHPDIFLYQYKDNKIDAEAISASKKIIETAIKNGVYLEVNCGGIRKGIDNESLEYHYPKKMFWELVKEYNYEKIIIGLDSHNPKDLNDNTLHLAEKFLDEIGIKYLRVIPELK